MPYDPTALFAVIGPTGALQAQVNSVVNDIAAIAQNASDVAAAQAGLATVNAAYTAAANAIQTYVDTNAPLVAAGTKDAASFSADIATLLTALKTAADNVGAQQGRVLQAQGAGAGLPAQLTADKLAVAQGIANVDSLIAPVQTA